jgi:hypothetical protein
MNGRISVQGTTVFIRTVAVRTKGEGKTGFLLKWFEALDFAEDLIEACEEAKRNAEALHVVGHDRKNT